MRHIKKVFALFIVTTLVFILAACGSKEEVVSVVVQGETVLYDQTPEKSNITSNDYKIFVLYHRGKDEYYVRQEKNLTASFDLEAQASDVTKVTVTISLGSGKNAKDYKSSYFVAKKNDDTNIRAINLNYYQTKDLESGTDEEKNAVLVKQQNEVRDSLLNLVANDYSLKNLSLNTILGNTSEVVSAEDEKVTVDATNFQSKKQEFSSIKLTIDGKTIEHNVYTYRPSNNKTPIQMPSKIEYGFFTYIWNFLLIIPIGFLMSTLSFGGSFGWGIIFATIIVRTLAWPIYSKTNDLSINMSLAQPELDRVKAKYALKKDPASQQKMQMETMKIMKKYKVNMLGCFMPLLQMPLFIAMYQVVNRVVVSGGMFSDNITKFKFMGIIDLTVGGDIASYILAAIVGVSMFFLNRLSTKKPSYAKKSPQAQTAQAKQTEQTMKMVNIIMIVFMVFASTTNNGLALYWIIGNMYAIGQTMLNRKRSEKKYSKRKQEII
ncbi:Membrane insertion family protein, OxaA/YidC [Alteracholeplasma palmae J233]|uniref:Membrane insertion family protein, OxaA/YidC n=1 Tax=Alteracholeplasma palmae (strain ATCC 49389 / J233) TaxID=1318466 RepID=U4KSH5_ALTPJ|nr:membrane protein insertase YidC [Alteracholeplasma palmae]CCV65016.1 Membrane insertion family protein, OxaA/YidC [Alteracholeplasma palmae J233]